jgi:hypothetical protein
LWPFGVALRGEASNRLMLRWLKTVVVSDEEKVHLMRQVGTRKASASEPLTTCRNEFDGIETGEFKSSRDEPGGCPFIGQVVSGMQAARAWSAAPARNVGRRTSILSARAELVRVAEGSASTGGNREALSTVATPLADRLVVVMKLL